MSDLPRLLLCCFDVVPAPTAISRRMTEYLKGMSERFQVVVLTVKTPDHAHIERYHGARLLRVPVGSGDLAARVQSFDRAVRRQLDSEEYVMVHAFDPFGGYALCERRPEFGYKIVYDASALPSVDLPYLHDEVEADRRFIARVRRQELFCLMNADSVIVANELTREFITGLGVAREQTLCLPCPVDLGPYKPEVMGRPDATPMKLLHLGNLSSANDLGTVLAAMQLALQNVDLSLKVVGPRHPAHQARLEEQVAALKLTGKVEFQDPVTHDDLHKVLATADVGLLSLSDIERNLKVGSPLSRAAEYLAAGRPVIAADVGSARATLQEDGVVFYKPGDPQSLADALVQLDSEPGQRVKLGEAAREAALVHDGAKVRADLFASYVALTGMGVRAVGDAEATRPDEVTQLGQAVAAEDTRERKRKAAASATARTGSGEQKVTTDPALNVADTSPEAALGDRPAVMGVPIREEEPPVVLGREQQEVAAEFARVTTEPNAVRPTEPPVVMGMPLPEPIPVTTIPAAMGLTPGDLAAELAGGASEAPAAVADDVADTGSHLSLVPEGAPPPRPSRSRLKAVSDPPKKRARGSKKNSESATLPPAPPVTADEPPPELPTASMVPAADEPFTPARPPADATPVVASSIAVGSEPLARRADEARKPEPEAAAEGATPVPQRLEPQRAGDTGVPPKPEPKRAVDEAPALPKPEPTRAADEAPALPKPEPKRAEAPPGPALSVTPPPLPPPLEPKRTEAPGPALTPVSPEVAPAVPALRAPAPPPPRSAVEPPPASRLPAPAPSAPVFIPPLEVPPLGAPRSSSSGLSPAFRSSPSGSSLTPVAPAVAPPPQFVPLLTPPSSGPVTSPSGLRPPALPRTTSGAFATLASTPSAPEAMARPSGLFPDAPRVPGASPAEPEAVDDSEIEEVSDAEEGVEEVGADEVVEVPTPQAHPSQSQLDDAPEMAAEGVEAVEAEASPPPSAIDDWLAMLVHGYCPPESGLFNRHTPPTTMPGRDS